MGESSCISNSSYKIGLNEGCYNDGVVDRFKYGKPKLCMLVFVENFCHHDVPI